MEKIKLRTEQKVEDTWDLSRIFSDDDSWSQAVDKIKVLLNQYVAFKGILSESKDNLYQAINKSFEMNILLEQVYVYATMKYHQDTTDAVYQEKSMKAQTLLNEVSEQSAFFEPELMAIPEEKLNAWLAEPEFQPLKRYFDSLLRSKEHILDHKSQELLAMAGQMAQTAQETYEAFIYSDIQYEDVLDSQGEKLPLTSGRFVNYEENEDRELRKDAFLKMYAPYKQYQDVLASLFSGNIKQDVFFAKALHYSSTRAMHLFGPNIDEQVYDNLILTMHKHMDTMYHYVSLRKKMLGVEELHFYDVYMPLVKAPVSAYTFEEAESIIMKALAPLGEEYLTVLKEGFDNRWIDRYENKGKYTGAYSWGAYNTSPYVLINFTGNLDSVFTLAHEMGHSMHSYYTRKNQPYPYANYRTFVAEVASTVNEALLVRYLLSVTTEKEARKYLINHFLESFKSTVYRQTMFAEFERDMHKALENGESLTAQYINEHYYELVKAYFGPDMVCDEEIASEWARIPHFYTPFYVYQYATGFSAAIALSDKILKGGEEAVKQYLSFLKLGSYQDPIDLLKIAGVDMSTAKPIESALQVFEELISEMEELL